MANENSATSEYTKTYTTFSGCDIVASFGDTVIGELQAITYSVSREKAPVYTMGSPEPRSFSRGKRGIAGTLVFTVFDRDALIQAVKTKVNRIGSSANAAANTAYEPMTIDKWDEIMSGEVATKTANERTNSILQKEQDPLYADELPPFDVTISFAKSSIWSLLIPKTSPKYFSQYSL